MKKLIISILALFISVVSATAETYPNEYLGLPGDNLNLYATMKLFQGSETLEGFERSLNDQNLHINNLDLNGDNLVDYITVTDYIDGNVHNIVLRTALNSEETQDIAVFTVERFDDGTARIQLIGDEALYGKNYIVEPIYTDSQETPNPGYIGNSIVIETPTVVAVTTYEVAAWPIIRFIFRPAYTCWHSLWTWGYYPSFWNPWHPYYWHTYYGYHAHFYNYYYGHYRHWNHYRYNRYNNFYYSHVRTYSPRVSARIRAGNYRTTYSRPDLRKRGDELYSRTARRSTSSMIMSSENRSRTSGTPAVKSQSRVGTNSSSTRRSGSYNSTRTQANSSINRRSGDTRKSTTIRSDRSTTNNPHQASKRAVSQRPVNRSSASYKSGTAPSVSRKREMPQKSTTVRNSRSSRSSSVKQNSSQPKRSSATYSKRSNSKPKVASRSSNSRSSSRPKVSTRSNSSSSSNSKSVNRSSQSRSSSNGRSGRR